MHASSLTAGVDIRRAGPADLARALQLSRADTLATFAACARALGNTGVPQRETLNPPLWELGHLGWFQEHWIARNPQRDRGVRANPDAPRAPGVRAEADALYDSSRVAHATRWSLALPDADATRADLARQLDGTLALLDEGDNRDATDDALYFFRLALLHEDMHHEAALYMMQSLGIANDDARWQPAALPEPGAALQFDAGPWRLGEAGDGFAFDNELGDHTVALPAVEIDGSAVRWAEYLPVVDATGCAAPRYLRRADGAWQQWRHGQWSALDLSLPACHLTAFEAQAWCRWAGRRLPTEAEWERAAIERSGEFRWGDVWEWTATPFEPWPGFVPHPYRDYSAPWFGDRTVLRGASFMTQPRMRHPRYRNFFQPDRADVPAGFRSCR